MALDLPPPQHFILPPQHLWTRPALIRACPSEMRAFIEQWQDANNELQKRGVFPFPFFPNRRVIFITIGSNQTDLNLRTFAGSLADTAGEFIFTNAGQTISASGTGAYACRTGSFPAGSTLKLINNGNIWGAGGNGGGGGGATPGPTSAQPGTAGGPAFLLEFTLTLDNGSGFIFGGGGGGGGGGRGRTTIDIHGGGGGGGGRSSTTTSGGAGGLGANAGGPGAAGSNGGSGGQGGGGGGSSSAGDGGAGGDWGAAGTSGTSASGFPVENSPGASGGAAGAAIALNGFSINIIAGNDSTHIKGSVS